MNCATLKRYVTWQGWLLFGIPLVALSTTGKTVRVYVDYQGGNKIDVIDPMTYKVTQTIKGIKDTDCIMFSPDGRRVYITSDLEHVVAVVDQATGEIIKKVPLSGFPNTVAVTKDGRKLFVGIAQEPGVIDVIDAISLERVKSIPMKGPLHDIYLTPDGKYVVAGSDEKRKLTVVDVQTDEPIWELNFESSVLTSAIEANPDGSTHRIFVMRDELRGFDVVDFAERKVVAEIKLPETAASVKGGSALGGQWTTVKDYTPCHGTGVSPDNKTFWINSHVDRAVYVYSLPDLKLLGSVPIGMRPNWLAFSPDGKQVYDLNTEENTMSVIDVKTLKEVTRVEIGKRPPMRKENGELVGFRPYHVNVLELP